jgi:hypothetical protein
MIALIADCGSGQARQHRDNSKNDKAKKKGPPE